MSSFRQLMMKKKSNEEYTFLNYIEMTQYTTPGYSQGMYIDTGYSASGSLEIKTKIEVTTTDQNIPVFGCYTSNGGNYMHLTPYASSWYYTVGYANEQHSGTYNPTIGQEYVIDFNNNGEIIINDTSIASGKTFQGSGNIAIGRRGSGTGWYQSVFGVFKYYYFQIYDNGVLVRDFRPAKRNVDNVLGFLDMVNNVFYVNAGQGSFIGG